MLLKLQKVSRFHGKHLIFKDISLEIKAGSITILAGQNGAGKTTLLHLMAGLIAPSSGKITLVGEKSSETSIGLVGHETFIYPELSAVENLLFWGKLHSKRIASKDCEAALEKVDLLPFAHEKAGAFSRGMAQRLSLARVFMLKPSLLLLDEPATGLDTNSVRILYKAITDSKAQNMAVVWISHNVGADLPLADNIALLAKKRLAYWGEAENFLSKFPEYAPKNMTDSLQDFQAATKDHTLHAEQPQKKDSPC